MPLVLIDHHAQVNGFDTIWKTTLSAHQLPSTVLPMRNPNHEEPEEGHVYFLHADVATRTAWNVAFQNAIRKAINYGRNFNSFLIHISVNGYSELPDFPTFEPPHTLKIVNFVISPGGFYYELINDPYSEISQFITNHIRPMAVR